MTVIRPMKLQVAGPFPLDSDLAFWLRHNGGPLTAAIQLDGDDLNWRDSTSAHAITRSGRSESK
jgi:hypothetical protein